MVQNAQTKEDMVYEVEFIPDQNGLCNRRDKCLNYEFDKQCQGQCHYAELEKVDEHTYCDNFYPTFKNEQGLIINLIKADHILGEGIEADVQNYCCAEMKHFLDAEGFDSCEGGFSPIAVGTSNPIDNQDDSEMTLRLYRIWTGYRCGGLAFGRPIKVCPFCEKKVQIVRMY